MLGVEIDSALGEPPHYLGLVPASSGVPVVSFHRVPEAKVVKAAFGKGGAQKDRLHFDIAVDHVETTSARIEDLGACGLLLELRPDVDDAAGAAARPGIRYRRSSPSLLYPSEWGTMSQRAGPSPTHDIFLRTGRLPAQVVDLRGCLALTRGRRAAAVRS